MKQNFEMVKGDTMAFGLEIEFDEDPQELEEVYFSCKSILDNKALFRKDLNNGISLVKAEGNKMYYRVRIAPQDTKNLEVGRYNYDLEIRTNGDVYTILRGILNIVKEITE